jgi:hypothetical protein
MLQFLSVIRKLFKRSGRRRACVGNRVKREKVVKMFYAALGDAREKWKGMANAAARMEKASESAATFHPTMGKIATVNATFRHRTWLPAAPAETICVPVEI